MEKLYRPTSKAFLKMAGGRMHTPGSAPSHKLQNHQKSLAYFSHLTLLIFFFLTKKQSQKKGRHGTVIP